jgi:hypothetical protein
MCKYKYSMIFLRNCSITIDPDSNNSVNPIYFVCFTTATIAASAILFQGFNTDNPVNVVSLICGFVIIFAGVYLLDSIARGAGATNENRYKDEEDEGLLMSESTLLENEDSLGLTELDDSIDSDDEEENLGRLKNSGSRRAH